MKLLLVTSTQLGVSGTNLTTTGDDVIIAGDGAKTVVGGDGSVRASTQLGRTTVHAAANAQYQPTFLFGAFGPIAAEIESGAIPESGGGSFGVREQRWLSSNA